MIQNQAGIALPQWDALVIGASELNPIASSGGVVMRQTDVSVTFAPVVYTYNAHDDLLAHGANFSQWMMDEGGESNTTAFGIELGPGGHGDCPFDFAAGPAIVSGNIHWCKLVISAQDANIGTLKILESDVYFHAPGGGDITIPTGVGTKYFRVQAGVMPGGSPPDLFRIRHVGGTAGATILISSLQFYPLFDGDSHIAVHGDRMGGFDPPAAQGISDAVLADPTTIRHAWCVGDSAGTGVSFGTANDRLKNGSGVEGAPVGIIARGGRLWSCMGNHDFDETREDEWHEYYGLENQNLGAGPFATATRARASNVATIVTAVAHGLTTGHFVNVTGLGGTGYNLVAQRITVVNATTFTFLSTGTDETTTADTGGSVRETKSYFDVVLGRCHCFSYDDNPESPDNAGGISAASLAAHQASTMGQWLQNGLAASTSRWRLVFIHHAPYSSGSPADYPTCRFPFQTWGASVVFQAHIHNLEHRYQDGIYFMTVAMGGGSHHNWATIDPETQWRQAATAITDTGYVRVTDTDFVLILEWFDHSNNLLHRARIDRESVGGYALSISVADGMRMGESPSRGGGKAVADAAALADSKSLFVRSRISDALTLGDAAETRRTFTRLLAETVAVGDVLTAIDIALVIRDTLAMGDNLVTVWQVIRDLADGISMGEAITAYHQAGGDLTKAVADAITMVDRKSFRWAFWKELRDPLVMGDTRSSARKLGKAVADGMVVGETLENLRTFSRILTETVVLAETDALTVSKFIADAMAIQDGMSTDHAMVLSKAVADAIAMGDVRRSMPAVALSDGLTMGDTRSALRTLGKAIADTLTVGESSIKNMAKAVADALTMDDGRSVLAAKILADALSVGESRALNKGRLLVLIETVALLEANTGSAVADAYAIALDIPARQTSSKPAIDKA